MNRKEKESKVILFYKEGKTCSFISKKLLIGRKSIYRILKRNNIELTQRNKRTCKLCDKQIPATDKDGRIRSFCGTCNTNIRRYRTKKKAVDYKGGCCERCDWSGDISCFDFHHLNPLEKNFEINGRIMASIKWDKLKTELDKCEMLCAICHRIEHSNYKDENFLKFAIQM